MELNIIFCFEIKMLGFRMKMNEKCFFFGKIEVRHNHILFGEWWNVTNGIDIGLIFVIGETSIVNLDYQ